ncbi:MAG: FAD-binding oxidoreductase [Alphaproteobacteria bacterium]|nr:FAD-binding oxidoreductase [Alphaproteobacteria bacterium]MBU1525297.1 FAD-binding oxidoreductase [Alphaproteobacteria bacterium]MBU2118523.1 FAD-binding oxidoreductase [Alphaproteobacteria bacterium]MBU2352598.1 FAD-binding oxidoreductase [Alphaproteobacteria bacterium]MBU2382298.1 FAD-binding oxidoreductase [Alphaproteobacteria bacterium]
MSSSFDVIVIGAGVLGLASAAELAARGLAVTVIDPGGANASSVAAGMIAPAMEAASDDLPADVVDVLVAARALWPDFAARHGLELIEEGADWRGADAAAVEARLRAHGFRAMRTRDGVHAPDDARIDVGVALQALGRSVGRAEARAASAASRGDGWTLQADDGRTWAGRHLVVATGAAAALPGLPPRVAGLIASVTPIRGQLSYVRGMAPRVVVRTPAGYAVPAPGGVLVGASMDAGRRDLAPDVDAARTQVKAVRALTGVGPGEPEVRVAVRGALSDGLPAAGEMDGVGVALAPRRNGWLLAPLVAKVVADAIQGRPPGPHAAALGPDRPGLTRPGPTAPAG